MADWNSDDAALCIDAMDDPPALCPPTLPSRLLRRLSAKSPSASVDVLGGSRETSAWCSGAS